MVAQLSYNGGSTLLSVRRVAPVYHFFFSIPFLWIDCCNWSQLSHYIKQVNPPKFYLQHLVWGSYLSSLQNGAKCKTWLNSPRLPYLILNICHCVWFLRLILEIKVLYTCISVQKVNLPEQSTALFAYDNLPGSRENIIMSTQWAISTGLGQNQLSPSSRIYDGEQIHKSHMTWAYSQHPCSQLLVQILSASLLQCLTDSPVWKDPLIYHSHRVRILSFVKGVPTLHSHQLWYWPFLDILFDVQSKTLSRHYIALWLHGDYSNSHHYDDVVIICSTQYSDYWMIITSFTCTAPVSMYYLGRYGNLSTRHL